MSVFFVQQVEEELQPIQPGKEGTVWAQFTVMGPFPRRSGDVWVVSEVTHRGVNSGRRIIIDFSGRFLVVMAF